MKTVGGVTCTSYKQICCMLGILHDDDEWNKVLTEAFSSLNGYKSRSFFAVLMVFCDLPNSSELLNQHFEALTEDIRYRTPNIEERLYNSIKPTGRFWFAVIYRSRIAVSFTGHKEKCCEFAAGRRDYVFI